MLHFTASASADGYLIVRNTGSEPTFVPVDGTSYSTGTVTGGEIIYIGSLTYATDLLAIAVTDYHYVIYPYKGGGAATNYLTTNPVKAVINNRINNDFAMSVISKSSSAGLANQNVNVTFIDGLVSAATTLTATKYIATPANSSYGLPSGLNYVENLYYTVTSSAASPGTYVIVLDFSGLNKTSVEWDNVRVVKRPNSSSPWVEVTDKIIDRRADGLYGKLVLSGLSSFSDFAIASSGILPMSLLEFSAKAQGSAVSLLWKTAGEVNTKDFIVQHSKNGTDWNVTGNVAARGNTSGEHTYSFVHAAPVDGLNYYRLLQRDVDGKDRLSSIKTVRLARSADRIEILGNPVVNGVLEVRVEANAGVTLKNMEGRTFLTRRLEPGKHRIDVQYLAPGMYLLVSGKEVHRFVKR